MSRLVLVLLESDSKTLDQLSIACRTLDWIRVQKADRVRYTDPPLCGLDAIFLVLPAAERWGSRPIPGRAQVLETSAEDQRGGMPRYVVTGVVLRSEDPRGPIAEVKILVTTALEAVRQFNLSHEETEIRRLGFWAVNLLGGVMPEHFATIFTEVLQVEGRCG